MATAATPSKSTLKTQRSGGSRFSTPPLYTLPMDSHNTSTWSRCAANLADKRENSFACIWKSGTGRWLNAREQDRAPRRVFYEQKAVFSNDGFPSLWFPRLVSRTVSNRTNPDNMSVECRRMRARIRCRLTDLPR